MKENKTMTVYAAKCTGNATNCLYPTKVNLTDEEIARKAFSRDTVFAEYKGNYRSNDNFIRSNVIPFDCKFRRLHTSRHLQRSRRMGNTDSV